MAQILSPQPLYIYIYIHSPACIYIYVYIYNGNIYGNNYIYLYIYIYTYIYIYIYGNNLYVCVCGFWGRCHIYIYIYIYFIEISRIDVHMCIPAHRHPGVWEWRDSGITAIHLIENNFWPETKGRGQGRINSLQVPPDSRPKCSRPPTRRGPKLILLAALAQGCSMCICRFLKIVGILGMDVVCPFQSKFCEWTKQELEAFDPSAGRVQSCPMRGHMHR